MKRYYITPVVLGQDIDHHPENQAKINEFEGNKVVDIPTNPDGSLVSNWAIACVAGTAQQHQAILGELTIIPIPNNDNPDQKLSVPNSFRNFMSGKFVSVNSDDSLREIVTKSGIKHNSNFDFERFFVIDSN